ncbi:MAG: exodeoxyribonuclease VII large subunit [Chthoniobacterales bacterium]|nr:exodeoxyribonuclease VII large subunit [Chthoniobacterales bacterium]
MTQQTELSFFSEPQQLGTRVVKKISTKSKKKEETLNSSLLAAAAPKILSVTELTRRVATLLEGEIGEVWIEGEISNYRLQSSGHHYFTLKDAHAQIACVLFARTAAALPLSSLRLADGLAVQIHGTVTVYQPRGQYQLMVHVIQPRGVGVLQARFEALKQKLAEEGLFEPGRKRPLPRFPQRIGVVTSPTGAAIADFLNVLYRRHPGLQIVIAPVRVQGRGASEEIARAIEGFSPGVSNIGAVDVIVVTRGGGSLEDLWEFNEEIVARAVVASRIPVMSAVGHEIDYTICDFVADVRAPTPSAAAELLAADGVSLLESVGLLVKRLQREVFLQHAHLLHRWDQAKAASLFREPERRCWELQQNLDHWEKTLDTTLRHRCEQVKAISKTMASRLGRHHPWSFFQQATHQQKALQRQLTQQMVYQQHRLQSQYERLRASLTALSPQATLSRGFTITRNQKGKVIASSAQVNIGELLSIQFGDGSVDVVAEERKRLRAEG